MSPDARPPSPASTQGHSAPAATPGASSPAEMPAAPSLAETPRDAGASILRDALGRRIGYLRVSLTDRCNFRCGYCMPPDGVKKIAHDDMLRLEELAAVVRLLVTELGVEKVRVTGGEPLVRRGAIAFLSELSTIPGLRDLCMTTNGYLLEEMATALYAAGVRRLNVSLDTLRPDRFQRITGVDGLAQVLRGIDAARQAGFRPIKMNVVVMRENLDEVVALLRFGLTRGLAVRFIELMPNTGAVAGEFVPMAVVRELVAREFTLTRLADPTERASAATTYTISPVPAALAGTRVGFIAPVSEPFCTLCNRLRLRGDGCLVPCLSGEDHLDLKPYIRPTLRARDLVEAVCATVARSKSSLPRERRIHAMSRIGG